MPHLAVPAYFLDEGDHALLLAARPECVVLNPDSGPGSGPCEHYLSLAVDLRSAGAAVLWYIHLQYGRRPLSEVVDELQRYADWYGLTGVLFDEVPSDLRTNEGAVVEAALANARRLGAATVGLNPGTCPVDLANVQPDFVVTFEGSCADYLSPRGEALLAATAPWRHRNPRRWKECHLVHAACADDHGRVLEFADRRGAQLAYVTAGRMPNPWDHLSHAYGPTPSARSVPTPSSSSSRDAGTRAPRAWC